MDEESAATQVLGLILKLIEEARNPLETLGGLLLEIPGVKETVTAQLMEDINAMIEGACAEKSNMALRAPTSVLAAVAILLGQPRGIKRAIKQYKHHSADET